MDGFLPSTTVCRAAAGACDVVETCTGASAVCPPDAFATPPHVCRPAAGDCDVAERCAGATPTCPPDRRAPPGAACGSPARSACDAADTCNGQGICAPNRAAAGTPCTDDGNACTDDVCDGAGACRPTPNTAPCDDGNLCTAQDTCQGGICTGGPASACDDGNACTGDRCDAAAGCTHEPLPEGAPCEDGQECTGGDRCIAGTCQNGDFTCGRVATKPEVPVRGNDPVLKVTCETSGDTGGSERGSCEATGFLEPDTAAAVGQADQHSEHSTRAVARVEAADLADGRLAAAESAVPVALADSSTLLQVTRGTVRRPFNRRGRSTLKLRLNSLGKRLLRESGQLRVRVEVRVNDRVGRATTLQLLVNLLRRRR